MQPLPPTTTDQQDITAQGQRRVNLIWETTQALIALSVVGANIAVWVAIAMGHVLVTVPEGLTNALFLVVGFYFSRTNHTAIGGIGEKPMQYSEARRD